MVVHDFNPSAWGTEAGDLCEVKASLNDTVHTKLTRPTKQDTVSKMKTKMGTINMHSKAVLLKLF